MDIEHLRQKIASGELKLESSNSVIQAGELLDNEATSFKYEITHGWAIFSSYSCDQEWKAFYMVFFELICNQNYRKEELSKILSGIQMEDKR